MAFGALNRTGLLYKLLNIGVCGKLYRTVANLYHNTEYAVLVNGSYTKWFQTGTGVKQGDTLSPTLFSVYINDLVHVLKDTNIGIHIHEDLLVNALLYADDLVLLAETENDLQLLLNKVHEWCTDWRMKVNKDKTKIMHYRKNSVPRTSYFFVIGDDVIEVVDKYRYLGCILNEHLDYTVTANTLAEAAGRAVGGIVNKCFKNFEVYYDTYSKMYNSYVVPVADYAAGIWGFKNYDKANTVHNRAIRSFLGVHRFTSNVVIHGDMGWTSPVTRRKLEMLRLWKRLLDMPNDRLCKRIFMWDWNLKKKNWSAEIRNILDETGMSYLKSCTVVYSDHMQEIIKSAETMLMNKEITKWKNDLVSQSKLRTYCTYKFDYKAENYVKQKLSRGLRSVIAQIRASTLPIKIETGRFNNIPVDNRLCEFCSLRQVEDESHFMFHCPFYDQLRKSFIPEVCDVNMSDQDKWTFIFEHRKIIKVTAVYIKSCMEQRAKCIFRN